MAETSTRNDSPGSAEASPTITFPTGIGVAVGDSGVGVGGIGVAVGDSGVGVGGTGVAVGDSGVGVGGIGVGVGDSGVGGIGVGVGGIGVGVGDSGVGVGDSGTGVAVGVSGTGVGVSGTGVGVSGTTVGVSGTAVGVSWDHASTATKQTQSPKKSRIPSTLGIPIGIWLLVDVMEDPLSLTFIPIPSRASVLCHLTFFFDTRICT